MATNGKMIDWDTCALAIATSQINTVGDIRSEFLYTPDIVTLTSVCYARIYVIGTNDIRYEASWPGGFYQSTDAGAGPTAASLEVRFRQVKIYGTLYEQTDTEVGSIEIWKNGTLVATYTNWSNIAAGTSDTSTGLGPLYVWGITGICQVSGGTATTDYVAVQISGGWRFKESSGGAWQTLPITLPQTFEPSATLTINSPPPPLIPAGTTIAAPYDLHLTNCISATSTYGNMYTNQIRDNFTTGAAEWASCVFLVLVPDISKALVRMHPDYKAMIYRVSAPEVTAAGSRNAQGMPYGVYNVTASSSASVPPYNALSEFLEIVGPTATSALDTDVLSKPSYSCCFVTVGKSSGSPGYITEELAFLFPDTCDRLQLYDNDIAIARYINSLWCNPWWSIFLWTQPSPAPQWWSESWTDYWGYERAQWLDNALLPSNPDTRTDICVWSGEDADPWTPWLDTYVQGLRWTGASRFKVGSWTPISSFALTQTRHGEWKARLQSAVPDGTITFSSGTIDFGSFSAAAQSDGKAIFDLELGSFTVDPFLLLQLAESVSVSWPSTNVSSIHVYLVGQDGQETSLGTSGGSYAFPQGNQSDYAGSWGIDNGVGVYPDQGTDALGNGTSVATMSDPLREFAFGYASGRSYRALRFKIVPTSWASGVSIYYPSFGFPGTHPVNVWESCKASAMIWPSGPGVRWGNWTWYDPGVGFEDPPEVTPIGVCSTAVDWFAWYHRVFQGDGGNTSSFAAQILTDASVWYDSFEVTGMASLDSFSGAFVLPKGSSEDIHFGVVSFRAELPPYAGLPVRAYNSSTWAQSGGFVQERYDLTFETKNLISTDLHPAKVQTPGSVDAGGFITAPTGWSIYQYNPRVNGSEGATWIANASGIIAHISPWHGYFTIPYGTVATGFGLAYDISLSFRHARVTGRTGSSFLYLGFAANANPSVWTDNVTPLESDKARIRYQDNHNEPLGILYPEPGTSNLLWVQTEDEGATFTMAVTITSSLATGGFSDFEEASDFLRWFYWQEGSGPYTIWMLIMDAQNNIVQAAQPTNITNSDLSAIAVREFPITGGGRAIGINYTTGGVITFMSARDGVNFS